ADDHEQRDREPGEEAPDLRRERPLRGRRLPVERDGRERPGRKGRAPVSVDPGALADPFLQRRSHRKNGASPGARTGRIADRSATTRLLPPIRNSGRGLQSLLALGLPVGLVPEVRTEQALRLANRATRAGGVRGDLVAADPADGEVAGL